MRIRTTCFGTGAWLTALLGLAGCSSSPPMPVSREERIDVHATVESIDHRTRMLVLRAADGRARVVQAGPAVLNLDQVKAGDTVAVAYYSAFAVEMSDAEHAERGVAQEVAAARAPRNARPAAAVGAILTTTVRIEAVDVSFNTVTFTRPDGFARVIGVADPVAQRFIRKLKRGDHVQVTYMEAIAVSVQPQA